MLSPVIVGERFIGDVVRDVWYGGASVASDRVAAVNAALQGDPNGELWEIALGLGVEDAPSLRNFRQPDSKPALVNVLRHMYEPITPPIRERLVEIVDRSGSVLVRRNALMLLDVNFPSDEGIAARLLAWGKRFQSGGPELEYIVSALGTRTRDGEIPPVQVLTFLKQVARSAVPGSDAAIVQLGRFCLKDQGCRGVLREIAERAAGEERGFSALVAAAKAHGVGDLNLSDAVAIALSTRGLSKEAAKVPLSARQQELVGALADAPSFTQEVARKLFDSFPLVEIFITQPNARPELVAVLVRAYATCLMKCHLEFYDYSSGCAPRDSVTPGIGREAFSVFEKVLAACMVRDRTHSFVDSGFMAKCFAVAVSELTAKQRVDLFAFAFSGISLWVDLISNVQSNPEDAGASRLAMQAIGRELGNSEALRAHVVQFVSEDLEVASEAMRVVLVGALACVGNDPEARQVYNKALQGDFGDKARIAAVFMWQERAVVGKTP